MPCAHQVISVLCLSQGIGGVAGAHKLFDSSGFCFTAQEGLAATTKFFTAAANAGIIRFHGNDSRQKGETDTRCWRKEERLLFR